MSAMVRLRQEDEPCYFKTQLCLRAMHLPLCEASDISFRVHHESGTLVCNINLWIYWLLCPLMQFFPMELSSQAIFVFPLFWWILVLLRNRALILQTAENLKGRSVLCIWMSGLHFHIALSPVPQGSCCHWLFHHDWHITTPIKWSETMFMGS